MKEFFKKIFGTVKWTEISASVYVRYIIGIISYINMLLIAIGKSPVNVSDTLTNNIYMIVSILISAVSIIVNTYKNNSTSKEAEYADLVLTALKSAMTQDEKTDIMHRIDNILNDVESETIKVTEPSNDTISDKE